MEGKTIETFTKGERHYTSSDRYLLLNAAYVANAPVIAGAVMGLSYREATEDFSVEVLVGGLYPVVELI
jgi:hypothetical protein